MLLHVRGPCRRGDHRLLFHAGDAAVTVRGVVSARVLGFGGAPGLDFFVNRCVNLASAATTAPCQTPPAECQEKGDEESANDGTDNGHDQSGTIDSRIRGSCCRRR